MSEEPLRVERVDVIDARVEPYDWAFARARADDVAAHWAQRVALRPRMFDGRVLLCHAADIVSEGGRRLLRTRHFETSFSSFDAWRAFGFPGEGVRNMFGMAALRGSDGAFILGQMAPHTASAGQIYFAAGTPDPQDVRDGGLDLDGSVRRELLEETSLTADDVAFDDDWLVASAGPRLGCMKMARGRAPAAAFAQDIDRRIAEQADPELGRMHVVARPEDIDGLPILAMNAAFLRWAFDAGV